MNRIEQLYQRLAAGTMVGVMTIEGALLRRAGNHRPGHLLVRHVTHGGLGRLLRVLVRTTGLFKHRGPVDVCLSFMRYYFGPFLAVERETADEAVFYMLRCPYGWRPGEDAELCDAAMELERQLVSAVGGTLVIEQTIAEGADRCRFRLKAKPRSA